jgi:tryptophan-rich sensory protein
VFVPLRRHIAVLAGCLALAFVPGVVGSLFQPGAWYAQLTKSPFTPPGWVFPVAWSILYATIGIALFVYLLHSAQRDRRPALIAFAAQLALNGAWSWLFFGLHAPAAALVDIVALWLAIAVVQLAFARHSRTAALLLLPYLAWVSFATYLNHAIVHLN